MNKEKTVGKTDGFLCYGLLATTAVVVTATAVTECVAAAAATAEEDEDKNDYPSAVAVTKVTHKEDLLFVRQAFCRPLTTHTMLRADLVLQRKI